MVHAGGIHLTGGWESRAGFHEGRGGVVWCGGNQLTPLFGDLKFSHQGLSHTVVRAGGSLFIINLQIKEETPESEGWELYRAYFPCRQGPLSALAEAGP